MVINTLTTHIKIRQGKLQTASAVIVQLVSETHI